MNRKLKLTFLLFVSFIMLFLCAHFRLEATQTIGSSKLKATILEDPYRDTILKNREFSTYIVSIQGSEEDLYSGENNILSKQYHLTGRDGERKIQIFVYDEKGTPLIAQNAGIRISGASSRSAMRKSFRVVARKSYDKSNPKFTYDFWNGRTTIDGSEKLIQSYDSFILHAVRLAMDATGIHNSVGYSLARKAGIVDASPTAPAALYINGQYQGSYFIMPAKTDNALAELYNIQDKNDIELVSVFEEEKTGQQRNPEVLEEYLKFVSYVQNSDVNDPAVIAEIERQLDVEQCLKYYAVNLLLANGDWIDNNLRVWRCKDNGLPYQDGKWRFFLFDLDWIGSFPDFTSITFPQVTQTNDYYNLLHSLLENPEWLERFREILKQMERDVFNKETIERIVDEEDARMIAEIEYDFQSEAFPNYLLYSVNSSPLTEEDYLTISDRNLLVEDFKNHLLAAPEIVNNFMESYYPESNTP